MLQPRPIFKAVTLASSILLVGGYVSYRANAFHWRADALPQESPVDDTADSVVFSGGDSAAAIGWEPVIMSGSKSGNGIVVKIDSPSPASAKTSLNGPASASKWARVTVPQPRSRPARVRPSI